MIKQKKVNKKIIWEKNKGRFPKNNLKVKPMAVKIICINKDNGDHYDPHEAIIYLGWINEYNNTKGRSTRMEMVDFIEGGNQGYVIDKYGNKVYLVVRTSRYGNKFVQTETDGKLTNNLLELPECR